MSFRELIKHLELCLASPHYSASLFVDKKGSFATLLAPLCVAELFSSGFPASSSYHFKDISIIQVHLMQSSSILPRSFRKGVKVLSWLVIFPRPLWEGVNVLGWLVNFPRPLWEGVNVLGWLVTIPRPLWERAEFQVERERNLEIRVRGQIHPNYCVILSPTSIRGRRISKTYFVILSPAFIQERRISKTLQERDSSGFRPQNDSTPGSLAFPRPLGGRVEFQVERERNLEIRVRGFKTFTPHNPRRCA